MIPSAEEFLRLRTSENPDEYDRAARDSAPTDVWKEVIERFPQMREWVAHNKTIPVEVIETLARDPEPRVRFAIAQKRRTPAHVLVELTNDGDETVRLAVAHNPRVPRPALERLASDPWQEVRTIARNKLTPG